MVQPPVNYGALLTQLDFRPLQQGLAQMHQNKMDREYLDRQTMLDTEKRTAAGQAQQRQDAFRQRFRAVTSAPTADSLASLRADFPEYLSEIGDAQKAMDARSTELNRGVAFDVYGRLTAGGADLVPQLDASLQRLSASGAPLTGFQTVRDLAASGKPEQMAAAKRIAAMLAAQYSGGNFGEVVNSLGRDEREAGLQPDRERRAEADADYAETRARYAPQLQRATLASKEASASNSRDLVVRRGERAARAAAPKAPSAPRQPAAPSVRPGERTARDAQGNVFVVRNNQWVRAR